MTRVFTSRTWFSGFVRRMADGSDGTRYCVIHSRGVCTAGTYRIEYSRTVIYSSILNILNYILLTPSEYYLRPPAATQLNCRCQELHNPWIACSLSLATCNCNMSLVTCHLSPQPGPDTPAAPCRSRGQSCDCHHLPFLPPAICQHLRAY